MNMPQDGLRSAVYRSFVKCDDPKGVAECKTMRKSKTSSKSLQGVSETKTITNDLNHSLSNMGKGKKIDFQTPKQETARLSSLQLKEASKGAQKLNQVIDTYSNGGMRFDRHSKEIAKDLLKGALDLQESLMVLGKLQEASHLMAKFRKKPKEKTKGEKIERQMRIQKSKSERYAEYNYQTGFQKPRTSIDGSSRDCYDELRTVIRDSLARQNLLPPNFHEKPSFSRGKMLDSMVDIPSTSSTQSSTMNFLSFTSSDTSFSSDSTKRSKGPNLVAKLMGLEEIPFQPGFMSSPKRFEIEKFPGQRRSTFEIDAAKVKKPQLDAYEEDKEEKKLREIVENARYKGLFTGNSGEGSRAQLNYLNSNKSKKVIIEDAPPIVIMKPMNVLREEPEENDFPKFVQKTRMDDVNRGAVDFDEVCRRLRGEETPMRKQGFREFKEKELSNKLKASLSVEQKEKKKKLERTDKVSEPPKKLGETENFKLKAASTSHDELKIVFIKERQTETEPISRRRSVSPQKSTPPVVLSRNKPLLFRKGGDRKKNPKLAKELVTDPLVEVDIEHQHGEKQVDRSCEDEHDKAGTSTTTATQLLAKEETDAPMDQFKDQLENAKLETIVVSEEEACYLNNLSSVIGEKCFKKQTKEKKLFLSSPSFLKYAEQLFDIVTDSQSMQLQLMSPPIDPEMVDTRLLLDVANELMLQKKLNTQLVRPPFLTHPKPLRICLSLTQLVDEVCGGLDDLSKYSENGNEKLITETLCSALEKDMLGTGLAHGAWELGWRHGYCFNEVEQVVVDIENCVFNELIESMFRDFYLLAF